MCELLAMSCRYPARLTLSLATLAQHAKLPSNNRDGWGLAFYQGRDAALYRDTTAADTSLLVQWVAQHGPANQLAMGYIRHGSQGDIALANTGPFARELHGRIHLFAHNGNLRGLVHSPEPLATRFQPIGDTDSEQAFCQLLELIALLPQEKEGLPSFDARLAVVTATARAFRDWGPSNFYMLTVMHCLSTQMSATKRLSAKLLRRRYTCLPARPANFRTWPAMPSRRPYRVVNRLFW